MEYVFSLLAEFVTVVAVVSGIQFAILAFRNPLRSPWLRTGLSESVIVVAIVGGLSFSVAMLITGIIGTGIHVIPGVILGVLLPLAVAFANERIFGVRERLRRADAGQSPFGPLTKGDASGRPVAG
jgi:hypothetical protein